MSRDVRPASADGAVWELAVVAPRREEVRLDWNLSSAPGAGREARLIDPAARRSVDLATESGYSILAPTGSEPYRLLLAVGSEDFVRDATGNATAGSFPLAVLPVAPHPARGSAVIQFTLPTRARASVGIFDVNGRLVQSLVSSELPAGLHTTHWSGASASGASAPPGVYYVQLRAGGQVQTRRLVFLK
jgi:hypothetical protein